MSRALGLVETYGLVAAIEAADAGLKAADVELLNYDIVKGGLITVKFWGEVAAVQTAVDVAAVNAQKVGKLLAAHVITGLADELTEMVRSSIRRDSRASCEGMSGNGTAGAKTSPDASPAQTRKDASGTKTRKHTSGAKTRQDDKSFTAEELEKLTVIQLRKLARTLPKLAIYGRQISKAGKQQLIVEILRVYSVPPGGEE
ncbi:MAG: BMC domain-containing protein [Eubacteriales bacterium]